MFGGSDFKGINTDSIPNAKTAIENYITTIQTHLKNLPTTNVAGAFKGQYSGAVATFIQNVAISAQVVLTEIGGFPKEIEKASQRYAEKDAEVSASIKSSDEQPLI